MSANRAFFVTLLLSFITLIGLATIFIKTVPILFSHAVYVCQKTFSNVIFALSHSVPLLLIMLTVTILSIGILTLAIQILKTRKYLKKNLNKKILIPVTVKSTIQKLNLNSKIDIVEDSHKFSFCYGLIKPKICISTGLLKDLIKDELKAVLLHESYHLKNHDPLKIILGKAASMMFFFIPVLKDFQNFYAFSKEVAADKLVISGGYRQQLLSVLSKLLVADQPKFSGVAAFAEAYDLEKRILYLTEQKKTNIGLSKRNLLLSFSTVLLLFIVLSSPVHAIAMSDKTMDHSYFICPFGGDCINSCKKEIETMSSKNFSEELPYTPVK